MFADSILQILVSCTAPIGDLILLYSSFNTIIISTFIALLILWSHQPICSPPLYYSSSPWTLRASIYNKNVVSYVHTNHFTLTTILCHLRFTLLGGHSSYKCLQNKKICKLLCQQLGKNNEHSGMRVQAVD